MEEAVNDLSWLRLQDVKAEHRGDLFDLMDSLNKLHRANDLNESQDNTLTLLTVVGQFMIQLTGESAFAPIMKWSDGRRSKVPSDLTKEELETLAGVLKHEMPHLMRARYADVLWEQRFGERPHNYGKMAAEAYLAGYRESSDDIRWVSLSDSFRRGQKLARSFGWEKAPHTDYLAFIEEELDQVEPTTMSWDAQWFIERLVEAKGEKQIDFPDLVSRLMTIGERIHRSEDPHHAGGYYDLARSYAQKAKDESAWKLAYRRQGQLSLLKAREQRGGPALATTHHLACAIKFYDDAGFSPDFRKRLRRLLLKWQSDIPESLHSFNQSTDASEAAEWCRERVTKDSVEEAIFSFAWSQPLVNYDKFRIEVVSRAKQSIVNFIANTSLIGADGRTTATLGTLDEDSPEELVEQHMMHDAQRFNWNIRAQIFIQVCKAQIFSQHHPTSESLLFLVKGNPLIPPGHEELFLRGILAGFQDDPICSVSILAPQLEGLVRHLLQQNEVVTSNLDNGLIQDEKTLGTLLDMPEAQEIIGKDWCFELKGLLCSRFGYNLRNEVAHGMLPTNGFYSVAALNLWWISIRLLAQGHRMI